MAKLFINGVRNDKTSETRGLAIETDWASIAAAIAHLSMQMAKDFVGARVAVYSVVDLISLTFFVADETTNAVTKVEVGEHMIKSLGFKPATMLEKQIVLVWEN